MLQNTVNLETSCKAKNTPNQKNFRWIVAFTKTRMAIIWLFSKLEVKFGSLLKRGGSCNYINGNMAVTKKIQLDSVIFKFWHFCIIYVFLCPTGAPIMLRPVCPVDCLPPVPTADCLPPVATMVAVCPADCLLPPALICLKWQHLCDQWHWFLYGEHGQFDGVIFACHHHLDRCRRHHHFPWTPYTLPFWIQYPSFIVRKKKHAGANNPRAVIHIFHDLGV